MKNLINLASLLMIAVPSLLLSQVIIGDGIGTAANKNSVLLEFANTNNKGIILPYVTTLPTNPVGGTILVDAVVNNKARVKYYDQVNLKWQDISGIDADLSSTGSNVIAIQTPQEKDGKVIIGSNTSSAEGVLVLESNTKAMVLPTVSSTNNIKNPSPGMIVYVKGATANSKRLAVFNGNAWSLWKP